MPKKFFHVEDFLDQNYSTLFILGARGVGKTVSSISYYVKHCYENKSKFIYLRRYQSEIDTLGFNYGLISKITGLEVTQEGIKDESGRRVLMITANGAPVGYMLALSVASKYKSTDYTGTEVMVYDEFIDIRGRELKNETNLYLNFAMTVFRDFSKYKAIFLANATNLFNCYFVNFNTFPKGKITKYKKLGIKIVMYQTSAQLAEREKTPLARLVRQAGDSESSLDNSFSVDQGFIGDLSAHSKCFVLLKLGETVYGYWRDGERVVISTKYDPSTKARISIDDLDNDYIYEPEFMSTISMKLSNNHLVFNNELTRGVWLQHLKSRRMI